MYLEFWTKKLTASKDIHSFGNSPEKNKFLDILNMFADFFKIAIFVWTQENAKNL